MPDRVSAFRLEDELKPLYPLAVGRHGVWRVELELSSEDEVAAAFEATQAWVRDHASPVVVRVG